MLHHEWSFGLNRWKLNTERIKACEYDEIIEEFHETTEILPSTVQSTERTIVSKYEVVEEYYETTEVQRTETKTVEIEIRLVRLSKI